jgi:hypothetical protein
VFVIVISRKKKKSHAYNLTPDVALKITSHLPPFLPLLQPHAQLVVPALGRYRIVKEMSVDK